MNSCAPKWLAVPAPLVIPVVLLLTDTRTSRILISSLYLLRYAAVLLYYLFPLFIILVMCPIKKICLKNGYYGTNN
jgi:hypothetical protein